MNPEKAGSYFHDKIIWGETVIQAFALAEDDRQ
jgi:hypothetical protein